MAVTSLGAPNANEVPIYSVYEVTFQGQRYSARDNPVRDIELLTTWQHEASNHSIQVYGFFDGNGKGGVEGNVFKVRFCPIKEGQWKLVKVQSNDRRLQGQNVGHTINAVPSGHAGFWTVDLESPGKRWFKRSDGTHPYITGNTMYSFLSEYFRGNPTGGNIKDDIVNNSKYFKKVRIGITGDRYPNPVSKPFLDENGRPTDDGNYSHRPNPEWFFNRLDLAVKTAFEKDLITDLILSGPDVVDSRSTLLAAKNNYDFTPYLKYIAARYGSYPNVWICLANEYDFDHRNPVFSGDEIARIGHTIQRFLPYETPVSVHGWRHWQEDSNTPIPWFSHVILQAKLKQLTESADNITMNYHLGGGNKPVINDELAYEGAGDKYSREDVVEAFLGAFLGGGYASTGYKSGNKVGHYFAGNFKAEEHSSAENLRWFRDVIENNLTFWKMKPISSLETGPLQIFRGHYTHRTRIMVWEGNEYLIAGSLVPQFIYAMLPEGNWTITSYELISMTENVLQENASGTFQFRLGGSRAEMVHLKKASSSAVGDNR